MTFAVNTLFIHRAHPSPPRRGAGGEVDLLIPQQFTHVFAENVKFQVHHTPHLKGVKIGYFIGVGDDGHLEGVVPGIDHSQAHSVHGNGPFFYSHIALFCLFFVKDIFKRVIPAALSCLNSRANGSLVDMSLDNVPIQTPVHGHAAFQVDFRPLFQQTKV